MLSCRWRIFSGCSSSRLWTASRTCSCSQRVIRDLIREDSLANPLWGAPRIHGELLKVGIDVAQSTVAKYMVKGRRPPSQSWKTFLRNHADGIATVDFFVVPTAAFKIVVRPCHLAP